ncbi:MAG: lipopolysaccharide core heptose(II) kinase RfaY [Cetobacterium sp.]
MKRFKEVNLKGFQIYFKDEKYILISEKILEREYKILEEYKNDGRTFVALIEIDKKKYILKEFQKEGRDFWKRFLTLFNRGEAYTVLNNTFRAKNLGIEEVTDVYCAILKERFGIVQKSYILMEYIDGEIKLDKNSVKNIEKLIGKIHKIGLYHGDCNPYNFLFLKNGELKIIDSKLKKDYIGNRKKYDMKILNKYMGGLR